jgi:hypothetical protein
VSFSHILTTAVIVLAVLDGPKGGFAILVRQDLPHTLVPSLPSLHWDFRGIGIRSNRIYFSLPSGWSELKISQNSAMTFFSAHRVEVAFSYAVI